MAKVFEGEFHMHCEQGTGSFYAFQEEKFIERACMCTDMAPKGVPPKPHEHWSYDGLQEIKDKDWLFVHNSDGSLFYEGKVRMKAGKPVFKDRWYHYVLNSALDREMWGKIFHGKMKGTIIRD